MKTTKTEKITEAEKILNSLTGHYESDRKKLIDGIHYLRKIDAPTSQCLCLGVQLYKLLLENGLNESDVLNPTRLLDKVDGFMYNDQPEMALSLVEVVDAVQRFQKRDGKGYKLYCFENEIEAQIFQNSGILTKDVSWIESVRPSLLLTKAQILQELDDRYVQEVVNEALELNPVYFNALIFNAKLQREKNPRKYFQMLQDAWNYVYTPDQMVALLLAFYDYYENKEDYVTAYAVLSAVKVYEDDPALFEEIDELKQKMTHTVVTPFKVPTAEQIVQILQKEKINILPPQSNYDILLEAYKKCFNDGENIEKQKWLGNIIQEFAGEEDLRKIVHKKLKK